MKYDFKRIEKKWQQYWLKNKIYEPDLNKAKKPFYNLMMFPYLSAEGLHVGNMYAFVGSDIYGRFKRMQGYDVFEPIGLDGFGIHSENYALKIGEHPAKLVKKTEKIFYRQLHMIGNGFAWREKFETYDSSYYKWTQWIFLELFKNGLAHRKKAAVNWCPKCLTVLADEQVISDRCERCSTQVTRKELEQWFFRITKYADRLLKNLEKIDWSERIKNNQKNWIGKSEGTVLKFKVKDSSSAIFVFTTRIDTVPGATYLVIAPEHPLVTELEPFIKNKTFVKKYIESAKRKGEQERIAEAGEKTGVELKGVLAINPLTGKEMSVWLADYVLAHYGMGAIMAVPAHDERDFAFAKKFKLPIVPVVSAPALFNGKSSISSEPYLGDGKMINSGDLNGVQNVKAGEIIAARIHATKAVNYRLHDWLISRQRYWGPPIPMIFCEFCADKARGEQKEMPGWFSVPEKDLPVELPFVKNFRPTGTGKSPLAAVKEFYEVNCPRCGAEARRETDVSDTFLDSGWYYLRYPSVRMKNSKIKVQNDNVKSKIVLELPWNQDITEKWLPVHMYIGGAEHSVLHLLYARFLGMVFKDLRLTHFEEPFTKFRAHGLLIREGAKMSKSKGNVINPDFYIKEFGADTLRAYLMFLGPFQDGGDFQDHGILGISRFLNRVWRFFIVKSSDKNYPDKNRKVENNLATIHKSIHQTIKKVTEDIELLRFNTAISSLMVLLNKFERNGSVSLDGRKVFLKLLAPFAPHIAEELWHSIGEKNSIHSSKWPVWDERSIKEEDFELIIQINGKLRDKVMVSRSTTEKKAQGLVLRREKIKAILGLKKPKKIIYVPQRLINLVI